MKQYWKGEIKVKLEAKTNFKTLTFISFRNEESYPSCLHNDFRLHLQVRHFQVLIILQHVIYRHTRSCNRWAVWFVRRIQTVNLKQRENGLTDITITFLTRSEELVEIKVHIMSIY